MLNSNEPIKVAHLQKLVNQSMLTSAQVIEMVNTEAKKLWSFDKARNVLIEKKKIEIWAISTRKAKYLSHQEVQKKVKLLIFRSDFRKKRFFSKSVTRTLYRNKVLVSECIFKLVCDCESYRLCISCV